MIGTIVDAVRKAHPSPVAGVDGELQRVREQLAGLAEIEAIAYAGIDKLTGEMRLGLEGGRDTSEIEGKLVTARVDLKRHAEKRAMLEKIAGEKTTALKSKKHRLRVAALEAAEAASRVGLAAVDEEIIKALLVVSGLFGKRGKLEHDTFGLCARLQHLGGVPRGTGDIEWNEAPLTGEFLRVHQEEVSRPRPFAEVAWGPFILSLPVLMPARTTAALLLDDAAAT